MWETEETALEPEELLEEMLRTGLSLLEWQRLRRAAVPREQAREEQAGEKRPALLALAKELRTTPEELRESLQDLVGLETPPPKEHGPAVLWGDVTELRRLIDQTEALVVRVLERMNQTFKTLPFVPPDR